MHPATFIKCVRDLADRIEDAYKAGLAINAHSLPEVMAALAAKFETSCVTLTIWQYDHGKEVKPTWSITVDTDRWSGETLARAVAAMEGRTDAAEALMDAIAPITGEASE